MRKILFLFLRIAISIAVLFILFQRVELSAIIKILYSANKPILALCFITILSTYIIGFLRWRMLLIGLGSNLTPALMFRPFCIGIFCNLLFPSTVGGDLLRSIDLGRRIQNPRRVVASVILDRLSGYSALTFIALLSLLLGFRIIPEVSIFIVVLIIFALLISLLGILFNNFIFSKVARLLHFFGGIGKALSNLHYEIYNFRNQKKIIIKNFIYSLIIQLIMACTTYLIALALGAHINPLYFFMLMPIVVSISALPISIAGLGLREASSMYFFSKVGMSSEIALSVSLLTFFIIFLISTCGGIIYVITFSDRRL